MCFVMGGSRVSSLTLGIKGLAIEKVDSHNTAIALESGELPVYATPAMIALLEKAAYTSVAPYLASDITTVGTKVEIEHVAASAQGMQMTAFSELVAIEGKRLLFQVEVKDEIQLVGKGLHERYIVSKEKFLSRVLQNKK